MWYCVFHCQVVGQDGLYFDTKAITLYNGTVRCVMFAITSIEKSIVSREECMKSELMRSHISVDSKKSFPAPMAHRAAPISVSIALGHASANAVKATAGGWSTGSSGSLTFPLPFSYIERETRRQWVPFLKSLVWLGRGLKPTNKAEAESNVLKCILG